MVVRRAELIIFIVKQTTSFRGKNAFLSISHAGKCVRDGKNAERRNKRDAPKKQIDIFEIIRTDGFCKKTYTGVPIPQYMLVKRNCAMCALSTSEVDW